MTITVHVATAAHSVPKWTETSLLRSFQTIASTAGITHCRNIKKSTRLRLNVFILHALREVDQTSSRSCAAVRSRLNTAAPLQWRTMMTTVPRTFHNSLRPLFETAVSCDPFFLFSSSATVSTSIDHFLAFYLVTLSHNSFVSKVYRMCVELL